MKLKLFKAPVAQWIERRTPDPQVARSNRVRRSKQIKNLWNFMR